MSGEQKKKGGGGQLIVDEYVKQPPGSPQGNTRATRASGHCAALRFPPPFKNDGAGGGGGEKKKPTYGRPCEKCNCCWKSTQQGPPPRVNQQRSCEEFLINLGHV